MRKDYPISRFSTLKRLYRFVMRLSSTWEKFLGNFFGDLSSSYSIFEFMMEMWYNKHNKNQGFGETMLYA